MDGGYLTAVRTGAVSGVATKYLARTDKGQVAGIFGAGVQARMQLWAMATARELSRAYVYDVSADATFAFMREMSAKLGLEIRPADSPAQVLAEADIVCTATSSSIPLFDGSLVQARDAHQRHRKSLAERARTGHGHYPAVPGSSPIPWKRV